MNISTLANSIEGSPTLRLSAQASEMRSRGLDVIALTAGELDLKPPAVVVETAKNVMDRGIIKYTSASGMPQLRDTVAKKFSERHNIDIKRENVIITAGAKQALSNLMLTILEPNDEVLIPIPYWVSYPEMVKLARGKPVFINTDAENKFKVRASDVERHSSSRTRAIMLNSPSNPTGAVYSRGELEDIISVCKERDILIVSDEIYFTIVLDGEHTSLLDFGSDFQNYAVVINGVSKAYAMTGWRLGWAIAAPDIVSAMGRIQSHQTSNPCTISQYAAMSALECADDFAPEVVEVMRRRREIALEKLQKIDGFAPIIPEGAFYFFCDVRKNLGERFSSSEALSEFLLKNALVATVPGEAFGMPGFLRISIAIDEEKIVEAFDRIEKALRQL